jgi:hypothetical protein
LVDFFQTAVDADEYNVTLVKKWLAENNNAQDDTHDHNYVE